MVSLGTARYHKAVERAKEREEETSVGYGQRLLSASLVPYIDALQAWVKEAEVKAAGRNLSIAKFFKLLPLDLIAFVSAKGILDCLGLRKSYPSTALHLGKLLEDEYRFRWLQKKEPALWRKLRKQMDGGVNYDYKRKRAIIVLTMNRTGQPFTAWADAEKAKLGLVLLELFQSSTGLVETTTVREGKRTKTYLGATAKTVEWIQNFHSYAELLAPFWLPTVEPPIAWENPFGGGYSDEQLAPCTLVKRCSPAHLKNTVVHAVMPEVYQAVNLMQNTPWQINQRVFGVMRHLWDAGAEVGGLPSREDDPIPSKPIDIETNAEARKAWRTKAAKVHKRNASTRSQRIQAAKVLWLAQKFSNVPKFYFPYQLDFRGRTYCIPYFLHPQGPDISRSLLTFAEGRPLGNAEAVSWLAIYGANLWGVDKVAFEERQAWVDSHRDQIVAVSQDPLANKWWMEAGEPWQFLAWCFEWAGYLKQGVDFVTHLPVCVDGTNNGLQILSLLTRDEIGGAATNVVQVGDKPADVYQEVADRALASMREDCGVGEKATLAAYWLDFGITRKTTKRPVMVMPYGGTYFSCADYIRQWYDEEVRSRGIEPPDDKQVFCLTQYLSKKVWDAIGYCVGRPRDAMKWLQECAAIITANKLPLRWTAPTGFPVLQDYKAMKQFQIETALGNKTRLTLKLNKETNLLSKPRQVNGVSPNFVHSLDAAALHRTVALANTKFALQHFCMIHDSYGALAPDIDILAACLRHVFADTFSVDLLTKLRDEWQAQLPEGVVLPPVPEFGSLDPSSVRSSSFFFA